MKYRLLLPLLVLAVLLCGCTGTYEADRDHDRDDRYQEEEDEEEEPRRDLAVDVLFQYETDDMQEWAVITGLDADDAPLWQIVTDRYAVAQMTRVSGIGLWEDRYYYVEDGTVVALDAGTGETRWENPDFGGAPAGDNACLILPDGTLYLTGYFGPDFTAISPEGETLAYISTIHEELYWPHTIVMENGRINITMEGGPEGSGEYFVSIDPETWEVIE